VRYVEGVSDKGQVVDVLIVVTPQRQGRVIALQDVVPNRHVDPGTHPVNGQRGSVVGRIGGVHDRRDGIVVKVDIGVVHGAVVILVGDKNGVCEAAQAGAAGRLESIATDVDVGLRPFLVHVVAHPQGAGVAAVACLAVGPLLDPYCVVLDHTEVGRAGPIA